MNMNMKMVCCLMLSMLFVGGTAQASHNYNTISGQLFGLVTQNNIDLNGDGANGRSGTLRARGSRFGYADVNVDSWVDLSDPQGVCGVGETQVHSAGQIVFSSYSGAHVVIAIVDPSTPTCLGLVAEVIGLLIIDGRGDYAGASGTGLVTLADDVVLGVDPSFPTTVPSIVYTHDGQFELTLD